MQAFSATIEIIGINPYVAVPDEILSEIFTQAGKDKGKIPVKLGIAGKNFTQTLVKYSGAWRLYLNTPMRKASNTVVGDPIEIKIAFDPVPRHGPTHPKLQSSIDAYPVAKAVFEALSPSRQNEIRRYINQLKSNEAVDRNIEKALAFLRGEVRFIGREKP